LIFIFDENIPPGVVQALRGAGEQARHIIEELGRGSQDEDVFQFLGSHRWYLVTADLRISRNPRITNRLSSVECPTEACCGGSDRQAGLQPKFRLTTHAAVRPLVSLTQ
jgi:hypothetical protein